MTTNECAKIMEIEDFLQLQGVFVNGLSGRPCHSDSYLTTVKFDALDAAFSAATFTKEEWLEAIEYWTTNPNMQPPLRLVAFTIQTKLKEQS